MTENSGTPAETPAPDPAQQGNPPSPYGQPAPPPPYAAPSQYPPQAYGQQPGYPQPGYPPAPYQQPYYAMPQQPPGQGLYKAAAIINWVVLGIIIVGTLGFGVIAAAWFVPMTIRIHKDAQDDTKHTALGVCTLLFCNIVSGILILVGDSDRRPR